MRVMFWTLPWQPSGSPDTGRSKREARSRASAAQPRSDRDRESAIATTLQQPELPWCFDSQLW